MKFFLEIADAIENDILKGTLLPGEKLLSVRALAKKLEVSEGTIQNALQYLKNQKLVEAKQTKGCFITEDIEYIKRIREVKADKEAKKMLKSLHNLGMTNAEIMAFFENTMKNKDIRK